jgi:hypothetical protein
MAVGREDIYVSIVPSPRRDLAPLLRASETIPQPMNTIWINVYQPCSSATSCRRTIVPAVLGRKYNQYVDGQANDRVQRRAAKNDI